RLPLQAGPQVLALDLQDHQVGAASEMQTGRFGCLRGRGEMDVAVLDIDAGAPEDALGFGGLPVGHRHELVDPAHSSWPPKSRALKNPSGNGRPCSSRRKAAAVEVGKCAATLSISEAAAEASSISSTASS